MLNVLKSVDNYDLVLLEISPLSHHKMNYDPFFPSLPTKSSLKNGLIVNIKLKTFSLLSSIVSFTDVSI